MNDTLNPPVQQKLYELALEMMKLKERIAQLERETQDSNRKSRVYKTAQTGMAGMAGF